MGSSDQPKALVDLEKDWKDQNCSRRSLKKIKKIKSLVDLFSSILCQKIELLPSIFALQSFLKINGIELLLITSIFENCDCNCDRIDLVNLYKRLKGAIQYVSQ